MWVSWDWCVNCPWCRCYGTGVSTIHDVSTIYGVSTVHDVSTAHDINGSRIRSYQIAQVFQSLFLFFHIHLYGEWIVIWREFFVILLLVILLLTSCRCMFLLFILLIAPLLSRLLSRLWFISLLLFSLAGGSTLGSRESKVARISIGYVFRACWLRFRTRSMGSCDREGYWSAGDSNNAMAFISGMRVLMGLISSVLQSLGVSLALIMIYIKKNRCDMSEIVFR